jgi:L-alanine-DL-glutamate epimerase-like enolase superfamily enzyme
MELFFQAYDLRLTRRWAIASRTGPGGGPGIETFPIVLVRLRDTDGIEGFGESAPSTRYGETPESVQAVLKRVDASRLTFADVEASQAYLDDLAKDQPAARCALDVALMDGAARRANQPLHTFLGLGFTEGKHVTCFSIGIATPEVIHTKVREAAGYSILKLKLGSTTDRENLAALRSVAPDKIVRVDANEAWKTPERALSELEWLAGDGRIELVEQPMPADRPTAEWQWLKARSPLPIMADESYRSAGDLGEIEGCFDAVNVKLVKAGGVLPALGDLQAARKAGLRTMLGCMIESSVLIAAAAHLAELTDYLDLDGNLLISNDPFRGPTAHGGLISMEAAPAKTGLRVARGDGAPV